MKAFLTALSLMAGLAVNAVAASPTEEIEHLIGYVLKSDVVFVRNGKAHTPGDAAEHLRKKWVLSRGKIATAEDFISLAASRSLVTGEPYRIRKRNGESNECAKWLTEELARFRKVKTDRPTRESSIR